MNHKINEVKDILEKYEINKIWNFSPKYYDAYINKICGDYLYENSEAFKNSKYSWIESFFWHTVIILLGAFVSIIKSCRLYKSPVNINKEAQIIACPFCGRFVWFKYLPYLINSPVRIVYHPLFHYNYYKTNSESYDSQKVTPEFYKFSVRDILSALFILVTSYKRLSHCSKELDDTFGIYTGKFSRMFLFPILYGGFIKRFVTQQLFDEQRKIWIFDYDYDYKYIVFNNVIHQIRKNDITVHLQHGSFVTFNPAYCNPVSDYSLCCSKREKKLIMEANMFNSNIKVLGAPLQTFDDVIDKEDTPKTWDVLCLLTMANDSAYSSMKNVLQKLDTQHNKIRVRYRPASKESDKQLLKSYVEGMEESVGKSLLEDVLMSKLVICFSEDALYTAIRANKPTIFVRDENLDNYDMSNIPSFFFIVQSDCISSVPISDLILKYKECNYENDQFVLNNFGYFRLEDIGKQLNSILSQIIEEECL